MASPLDALQRTSVRRGVAIAGLLMAVAVGLAVRWTTPGAVADLRPRPDALDYEEAARSLLRGDGHTLVIDGNHYPSHFPLGFSALIAPALVATRGTTGSGVWVVLAAAGAAIAAAWGLGRAAGGDAGGIAAAMIVALSPLHVLWSQAVMSDVPSSAAIGGVALWTVSAVRRGARWPEWMGIGAAGGLAATLRPANLLLLVPVGLLALSAGRRGWTARFRDCAALGVGAAIGVLPQLAVNLAQLGTPFASGRGAWWSGPYFAWRFALERPFNGPNESNLSFYLRTLAGDGLLYPWPVAILVAVGVVVLLRRPGVPRAVAVLAAGFAGLLLALHVPFYWQWDRYLLPALPLLAAVAGATFGAGAPRPVRMGAVLLAALAVAVLARMPAPYAPPRDLREVATLQEIGRLIEPNAALFARTNAYFFERFLRDGGDRVWLPLEFGDLRDEVRTVAPRPLGPARGDRAAWIDDIAHAPLDPGRVFRRVHALLDEGRPVYFTTLLHFQVPWVRQLHAMLASTFRLEVVARIGRSTLFRVDRRS